MPLIERDGITIDLVDEGSGDPVLLLHAGGSSNRQWRRLVPQLARRYRVLAPNLRGYGQTTPWPPDRVQGPSDPARIALAVCDGLPGPLRIVGHSYGGWVAMRAALELGERVSHLVLIEPCPYALLRLAGRHEALAEALALSDAVKRFGAQGRWLEVAGRFADYFGGDGTWEAMAPERREAFARQLQPNLHEWDGVLADETPAQHFGRMPAQVLVVGAPDTRRPIREMNEVLREACPHWRFVTLPEGGHMAPVTHGERVDPLLLGFLG
jgi:pimeloyl-ACP methyl ester carboxylesterase